VNIQAFQDAVASRVRSIPAFEGLPVREEQLGNIIETLQADIDKTSFCVVVGSIAFDDEAPDSRQCYGTASVAVTVFEDPELNRSTADRPTFLSAAVEIAKALKLFRPDIDGAGALTSPRIGEPMDLGDGVVSVTVKLSMKAEL